MALGPNMKKLGEMELADTVTARVTSGPGDLLMWEVRATVTRDGIPLELIGRGTDSEVSAAAVCALLEQEASGSLHRGAAASQQREGLDGEATVPPLA